MSGKINENYGLEGASLLSLTSKEEFAAEYTKRSCQKGKTEEFYIDVLNGLQKSIADGNIDSFKKLSDFLNYISTLEDITKLTLFYSKSKNRLKSTNFVILSCKHNSPKILEFIFGDVSKTLQNTTVDVGNKSISPDDEDEMRHNAFYYAIRSGNIELLDILINKWPCNYFSTHKDELNKIISNAYEELLLKNVPVSEHTAIYAENELIKIRFALFENGQNVEISLHCIIELVGLLRDKINQLEMEYLGSKKVDTKFLFIFKFIAQNIHNLKYHLRSTYTRLPWDEIEFCLIRFILYHVKPKETRFFDNASFTKSQILNLLQNFINRVSEEINTLSSVKTIVDVSNVKREKIIADIISKYPDFRDLYYTYQQVRNINSLVKISENLKLALSSDPKLKQDQLIITRVLYNIAELLKNTMDSPNLSRCFGEFLLLVMSVKTRSVLIDFYKSVSYSDSLCKRIELEQKVDANFFIDILNDFEIIDKFIMNVIHCYRKWNVLKTLLQLITETDNTSEIKEALNSLEECSNLIWNEYEFLELLIEEFCDSDVKEVFDNRRYITFPQLELMNEIKSKIERVKSKKDVEKSLQSTYFERLISIGNDFMNKKGDESVLRKIKRLATKLLGSVTQENCYTSHDLKEIAKDCVKLFHLVECRDADENRIFCKIIFFTVFPSGDVEWGGEIRKNLFEIRPLLTTSLKKQRKNALENMPKYKKILTEKVSELKGILDDSSYTDNFIDNVIIYKSNKEVSTMIEMLLLDILTIINGTDRNDHFFLDDGIPLLIGGSLLQYLARGNGLFDILPHDPAVSVILNANIISTKLTAESKKRLSESVAVDFSSIKVKATRNLTLLAHQGQMFAALEEGNLTDLKATLKEGADINAKNARMWSALHFSAKGPSLDTVKFVLEQNVNVNSEDLRGERPIHVAAANGRKNMVEFLIKNEGVYVNERGKNMKTPLHFAAENGHFDTMNALLDNNANHKCISATGFSSLHYAIYNDCLGVAKVLLQKEVNVDISETWTGQTCLHLAARNGNLAIVKFLLSNGADVNARDLKESTAMHYASDNGYPDVVKALVISGADVNFRNTFGISSLILAAKSNHKSVVNILLENKANVNDTDKTGYTPLHSAAVHGHDEIVLILLKNKANGYATDNEGHTPLHKAVEGGYIKVAALLIEYGVNTFAACNLEVFTPLEIAISSGYENLVELLIKNGADVNSRNVFNLTPLHLAARNGSKDIIDILIKNEALIEARDDLGRTPLGLAALFGNESAATLLIKYKADVNVISKDGSSLLHYAVQGGCKDIVVNLIQNGAEVNRKVRSNITPLYLAVLGCKTEIVEVLASHPNSKVDIINQSPCPTRLPVFLNHKNILKILLKNGGRTTADGAEAAFYFAVSNGLLDIVQIFLQNKAMGNFNILGNVKPLHLAAENGHIDLVKMFLKRGVSVNDEDLGHLTPLCYAARKGQDKVAKILIANGANVNNTKAGITPLHIASYSGHSSVVKVLLNNGAMVYLKNRGRTTALEEAIFHNNFDVLRTLLQSPMVEKDKIVNGMTLLHNASYGNCLKLVEYLVDKGCDINVTSERKFKAIHLAAERGNIDIVKFFLAKGMDINEPGEDNETLLHSAARFGHIELAKYLIDQGADVDVKDNNGDTPLHLGALANDANIVKVLLKNGAIFNFPNKFHRKPIEITKNSYIQRVLALTKRLFEASKLNNLSDVEKHIEEGAFVSSRRVDGGTPLHFAAWKGYDNVALILLKNEGNPNTVDNKGLTPLHYATKFSHMTIVKALLAHGAVYNSVSSTGKTPLDLASDKDVTDFLNLIAEAFQSVAENKENVVDDLNQITDTATLRAVMCAQNEQKKTLLVVAVLCNFSKVEELMAVSQDVTKITLASGALQDGNHEVALTLYKEILEERKKILGPDNPGTLAIESYIAESLNKLGNHQEALSMYEKIYEKQITMFGLNHASTFHARHEIGTTLLSLKRYEPGFAILQDHYHKVRELLSFDHSDTLRAQLSLSNGLKCLMKYEESIIVYRSVYAKLSDQLGNYHFLSIKAQKGIAEILTKQGKNEESLKIFKDVLEKEIKLWGIENVNTLETFFQIAISYLEQNKPTEALVILDEVWAHRIILGENHPLISKSLLYIGMVALAEGKFVKTLEIFRDIFKEQNAIICALIVPLKSKYRLQGNEPAEILDQVYNDFNKAAGNGHVKTIQRLIEGGIVINKKDADGRAPLHFAVSNGHIDIVDILLRSEADVCVSTAKGNTPIHTAASKGYKDIVEMLLKNVKPDKLSELVDAKTTTSGATALHIAAKNGHYEIVKSLLENGATYNIKNKEEETPLELGCENNEISNLLTFIEEMFNLVTFVDEIFKYTHGGKEIVINKLKEVKPGNFKSIANARNTNKETLLEVARGKSFEKQLVAILQLTM